MFEEVRKILDNILGVAGNGFVERTNASGKNLKFATAWLLTTEKRKRAISVLH